MRNKPMSMVTSNTMSVKTMAMVEGIVLPKLSTAQVSATGNHAERTYGCQMSQAGSKYSKLKINQYDTCNISHITAFTKHSPMICRRYLP